MKANEDELNGLEGFEAEAMPHMNDLFRAASSMLRSRTEAEDEEVLAAFREIPEAYREVVLLADVYEFSYKEIQQTLGIPIGTVMSRLSRGRQLLRTHLADVARA